MMNIMGPANTLVNISYLFLLCVKLCVRQWGLKVFKEKWSLFIIWRGCTEEGSFTQSRNQECFLEL